MEFIYCTGMAFTLIVCYFFIRYGKSCLGKLIAFIIGLIMLMFLLLGLFTL